MFDPTTFTPNQANLEALDGADLIAIYVDGSFVPSRAMTTVADVLAHEISNVSAPDYDRPTFTGRYEVDADRVSRLHIDDSDAPTADTTGAASIGGIVFAEAAGATDADRRLVSALPCPEHPGVADDAIVVPDTGLASVGEQLAIYTDADRVDLSLEDPGTYTIDASACRKAALIAVVRADQEIVWTGLPSSVGRSSFVLAVAQRMTWPSPLTPVPEGNITGSFAPYVLSSETGDPARTGTMRYMAWHLAPWGHDEYPEGTAPVDGGWIIDSVWPEQGGGGSLPDGGTTGQLLAKASDADGDADWVDPSAAGTVTSDQVTVLDGPGGDPLATLTEVDLPGLFGRVVSLEDWRLSLSWLPPVRVVSTSNPGDFGEAGTVIDGVTLAEGDRILQTGISGSGNRIYVVQASGSPASSPEGTEGYRAGTAVKVGPEGTTYGNTEWVITTPDPVNLGDLVTWEQFSSGGGSGPDLSDADPEDLGTADPGTSPDASRADHVHGMPTASDVGAVPTSRTLAGLDLTANRSASDIKTALSLAKADVGLSNVTNVAQVETLQAGNKLWIGTQAAYDALGAWSSSTVYVVTP